MPRPVGERQCQPVRAPVRLEHDEVAGHPELADPSVTSTAHEQHEVGSLAPDLVG